MYIRMYVLTYTCDMLSACVYVRTFSQEKDMHMDVPTYVLVPSVLA